MGSYGVRRLARVLVGPYAPPTTDVSLLSEAPHGTKLCMVGGRVAVGVCGLVGE